MASKKHKAKKSSITKPPLYHLRRQWPFTELPPTNPCYHSAAINKLFTNNNSNNNALAVTKSCLPTTTTKTTRCIANQNQPLQLHHVTTGPTQNPTPYPHYHYLHDSTAVIDAASKMPDASHWRVLTHALKPRASTNPPNPLGPVLHSHYVTHPGGPSPALEVRCTFSHAIRKGVNHYTSGSVWYVCNTRDPFDAWKGKKKSMMEFTSMVSFQGSYYAMSLQGAVAVMQVDVVDTRLTITGIGSTRAVPSSSCRFFKEYLFVMDGEIFLAFLIHRESLAVVDGVEVLRLDFVRMDWVKVERLRGKTVFLKERCVWVDSEEFGCGDDRVYFVKGLEKIWKVFDMKSCCISPVSSEWSRRPRGFGR